MKSFIKQRVPESHAASRNWGWVLGFIKDCLNDNFSIKITPNAQFPLWIPKSFGLLKCTWDKAVVGYFSHATTENKNRRLKIKEQFQVKLWREAHKHGLDWIFPQLPCIAPTPGFTWWYFYLLLISIIRLLWSTGLKERQGLCCRVLMQSNAHTVSIPADWLLPHLWLFKLVTAGLEGA